MACSAAGPQAGTRLNITAGESLGQVVELVQDHPSGDRHQHQNSKELHPCILLVPAPNSGKDDQARFQSDFSATKLR